MVAQSETPAQVPQVVPVRLSKAYLNPILARLLEPASVVKEFDGIALSAWPDSTQVDHYLVNCRGTNLDETSAMCKVAERIIAEVKQDVEIRSRWDFLTGCGLIVYLGVYQDPGMDCLSLHITRNPDGEANLRASLKM